MAVLVCMPAERNGRRLPETKLIVDELEKRTADVVTVDPSRWPSDSPLTVDEQWQFGDVEIVPATVDAAIILAEYCFRPLTPEHATEFGERPGQVYGRLEEHRLLFADLYDRLEEAGTRLVPERQPKRGESVWEIRRLREADVQFPRTIVTNDGQRGEEFYAAHDRVIAKSTWRPARVTEIDDSAVKSGLSLSGAPTILQEFVPGEDVRAYVVDGELVGAVTIPKDGVSYKDDEGENRRAATVIESGLEEIADAAVAAIEAVDQRVGSVDLVRPSEGGSPVVLEVNRLGKFAGMELDNGIEMSAALADYLTDPC